MASFILFTYSPTYLGESFPYFSIILIIALPTMAPSEMSAIFLACSGLDIPNPIAHGTLELVLMAFTMLSRSVLISLLVPVTPRLETTYMKPSASFAIC